jgi:hypothetical protein
MIQALIEKIVHTIETHSQAPRIKKLLFAAVNGNWENDPAVLNQQPLSGLVTLVRDRFTDFGQLQSSVEQIVNALNKKNVYVPVAGFTLAQLRPLYDAPEQPSRPEISWFDLCWQILKSAHPLRTKILLFSLLHHPFGDTEADWVSLKLQSLSSLLEQVLQRYSNLAGLSQALDKTVIMLEQAAEYAIVAQTLVEVLEGSWNFSAPAYVREIPLKPLPNAHFAPNPDPSPVAEEDLTCQFFPLERNENPPQ